MSRPWRGTLACGRRRFEAGRGRSRRGGHRPWCSPHAGLLGRDLDRIQTARLANEQLSGTYASSFKGQGLAFREVRPYQAVGDVRTIDSISNQQLVVDLDTVGGDIRRLYRSTHSTTKSLQAASHSELPGSLMFALAGLAVHGFEPVSLRYYDIEPDGKLTYLDDATLDARAKELADPKRDRVKKDRKHFWFEQDSRRSRTSRSSTARAETPPPRSAPTATS